MWQRPWNPASNSGLTTIRGKGMCRATNVGQKPWRSEMLKIIPALALGLLLALTGTASAQSYPTKPITMIIPFAAGGPTDVLGRVMAQRMSEILGQQIVVENVGGAGGMTGSRRVADAAPDGYSIVLGTVG